MTDTMRALLLVAERKLEVVDQELPTPGPGDALVRVRCVGVCGSDLHGYTGHTGRRIPPLVMGHEAAGEVVAVGEGVEGWTRGRPRGDPDRRRLRQSATAAWRAPRTSASAAASWA